MPNTSLVTVSVHLWTLQLVFTKNLSILNNSENNLTERLNVKHQNIFLKAHTRILSDYNTSFEKHWEKEKHLFCVKLYEYISG